MTPQEVLQWVGVGFVIVMTILVLIACAALVWRDLKGGK